MADSKFLNREPVMGWKECRAFIAQGTTGAFPTNLSEIGEILEKSAVLSTEAGEKTAIKKTGGRVVASETGQGSYKLALTIIEPTAELKEFLGLGKLDSKTGEFAVKGTATSQKFALQIAPTNLGAKGIKAPNCSLDTATDWGEENGHSLSLTFDFNVDASDTYYYEYTNSGKYPAAAPTSE